MGYYLTNRGNIIDSNRTLIPMDESSALYLEYVDYLRSGGTVIDTELYSDEELKEIYLESIPKTASKMSFFLALFNIGITRAMVYDVINQIPDENLKEIVLIKFDLSQEFDRGDEHLNMLANLFGITQTQLDDLFIQSNT